MSTFYTLGPLSWCMAGVTVIAWALYVACRKRSNVNWLWWTLLGPVLVAGILALLTMPAGSTSNRTTSVSAESTSSGGSIETGDDLIVIQGSRVSTADSHRPASPLSDVSTLVAQQPTWIKTAIAGGALTFLLVLAYLFLDAGQRGRYAWPLRLGTAIVFAGLCVLLWKIGPLM